MTWTKSGDPNNTETTFKSTQTLSYSDTSVDGIDFEELKNPIQTAELLQDALSSIKEMSKGLDDAANE